jgi:hypothetical protein
MIYDLRQFYTTFFWARFLAYVGWGLAQEVKHGVHITSLLTVRGYMLKLRVGIGPGIELLMDMFCTYQGIWQSCPTLDFRMVQVWRPSGSGRRRKQENLGRKRSDIYFCMALSLRKINQKMDVEHS